MISSQADCPSAPCHVVAAQCFPQLPVQLAGTGGRHANSEPLQSVTASDCKSSNAKVLFGAVKPHGFSLSTL